MSDQPNDHDDLFVVNLPPDRSKPVPMPRQPRESWKVSQHVRELRQGGTDWNGQIIADLCESFVGPGIRTRHEEVLVEQFTRRMSEGTAAVRRYVLQGPPPPRVKGKLHISAREQQVARDLMAKGEQRGAPLTFVPRFIKSLPYDGAPLAHGWIVLKHGMEFMRIDGSTARVALSDWPELPPRDVFRKTPAPVERGVPLIVGNGDARSVWEHLCAGPGAGVAIWQEGQANLFVAKLLGDECFPEPLELLRKRAQGE